jgi:hypothetical protein
MKKPIIVSENVVALKGHESSEKPVQDNLKFDCDVKLAGKVRPF